MHSADPHGLESLGPTTSNTAHPVPSRSHTAFSSTASTVCGETKMDRLDSKPLVMPPHWKLEFINMPNWLGRCLRFSFKLLCLLSLGHRDLDSVWEVATTEDERWWYEQKDRMLNRINNITVIAGLLLTSTSAFATTLPPVTPLFDYTQTFPYICSLASFGSVLGSLIVGSSILFMMAKCSQQWFRDTLMGSHSSICLTLILLAYPFFSIAAAACVMLIGITVAAYQSSHPVIRIGSIFIILIPGLLVPAFIYTQVPWSRARCTDSAQTPIHEQMSSHEQVSSPTQTPNIDYSEPSSA
ncbi:unnamed protein product [Somion occarium]|uniref:PGG domain-containing protein n=1 Tax=Somion occarium TaxID=3059160 RepID=A0ABP1CUJ5_9APHY